MAAQNTKGVQVCIGKGSVTPSAITVTAVTAAKPAALTTTGNTLVAGDVVVVTGATDAGLNGTWVLAPSTSATSLALLGSDNTGGGTTFGAGAKVVGYASTDMECLCLSDFSINRDTPGTISTATFCDPSASVPAVVTQAGTVTIGGYVDISATDFKEVLGADLDGKPRTVRVTLPNNGFIVFSGVISGFSYQIPLDGAQSWTAQITLSGAPKHLF